MKKTILSLAVTASLGLVSLPALALTVAADATPISINESAITGTTTNTIHNNIYQLAGTYNEIFSVTGSGAFNTIAVFDAGTWNSQTSSVITTNLNGFEPQGYQLYATFQSSGTFSVSGGVASFSGGAGTIQLWADPLSDHTIPAQTTFGGLLPTTAVGKTLADINIQNTTDDLLLGTANLLTFGNGSGNAGPGSNGNFELIFGDWTLANPDGLAYFTNRPFQMAIDLNGNFQSFDPTTQVDVQIGNSVANAFFVKVPEPGTLALLGLGLAGLGLKRRKAS